MKIRTQLIVAFIVLAVLPLTAIVSYSYFASIDALQNAHKREAAAITSEMDARLNLISESLGRRLTRVGAAGFGPSQPSGDPGQQASIQFAGRLIDEMGDEAELVDTLEIVPDFADTEEDPDPNPGDDEIPDPADSDSETDPAEAPVAAPRPAQKITSVGVTAPVPPVPAVSPAPSSHAVARNWVHPPPPPPPEPIVIDFDAITRSVRAAGVEMSAEDVAQMKEDIRKAAEAAPRIAAWEMRVAREHQRAEQRERSEEEKERKETSQEDIDRRAELRASEISRKRVEKERLLRDKRLAEMRQTLQKQQTRFARTIEAPIVRNGVVVGTFKAAVRPEEVMKRVFESAGKRSNEVPFAVDRGGQLFTPSPADKKAVAGLPLTSLAKNAKKGTSVIGDWVVALSPEPESGLVFGTARRIGEPLRELRQTAAQNFSYGLALIGIALIGVVPLANHITRDVKKVTEGAQRIAAGDLDTKLDVTSTNEVGQLAAAFNRMAGELTEHQRRLVEQETLRKEREIQQRLLELEYDRKTTELEEARRFQLSLLPRSIPQPAGFEIAVYMKTATEVGGDYYDFHLTDDGVLTVAVGDAVGHGAKAGTMVTVIKSLFSGYREDESPASFLSEATRRIGRMDLGRMSMGLTLARIEEGQLTVSAAAMPPVLVHRPGRGVEEIQLESMPLGLMTEDYDQRQVPLGPGDTVLMMSDGFPELASPEGHQLGYEAALAIFEEAAGKPAADVIAHLSSAAVEWSGDQPPNDDITFVVVKRV